jgi:N-acetylneuraminate synthase
MQDSEKESRRLRRSLYISENVKAGDVITNENLRAIRPGAGLLPKYLEQILGNTFVSDFTIGTPMSLDYVDFGKK